jgi:hypothetical protein
MSFKKQSFYREGDSESVSEYGTKLRKEILEKYNNEDDIFDALVLYLYKTKKTRQTDILWECFSDILVERLKEKTDKFVIPISSEGGDIEYLWTKYEMKEFKLNG